MMQLQLNDAVKQDAVYQELLATCESLEKDYIRIKESLTEADQEILDRYIALCEEMEYRRTCLALQMSKA